MVRASMGKLHDDEVVPEGEGKASEAVTVRLPKKLLERVERCAKETQNTRTDAMLHLMRWALNQYEGKGKK